MTDGARTRDNQNHNLGLYQLSYGHHKVDDYNKRKAGWKYQEPKHWISATLNGAPGGARTPDLLLRRQLLYPAELRALRLEGLGGI